jgi:hypothetical protein
VGHGATIHFTFEYDAKTMIPLFMVCFDQLNLISFACAITTNVPNSQSEEKKVICLVLEHPWSVLLFRRLFVFASACADPLSWW